MSLFIGVLISLCFLQVAVALPHANLPYKNVEVRAGSELVIPCDLTTDGVTDNEKIFFKWGFTPDGSDRYRTIMRRNDVKLHPGALHELRVHLHPTYTTQGDCSLVINPILMEDSGTYEVNVIVNGERSGPIKKTKVHVTDSPLMTAGKKFSARRTAMVQFLEPITTADEEQTAGMEAGQARPVVEGQTTGKKLNAKRKPMVHRPMTATIQTATAAEEQTAMVDKEPRNHRQTTGKKLNARRKPMADRPMTTTIQTATAAEEQTATVDEETIRSGENTILQYIILWWLVVPFLRKYVAIVAIAITGGFVFIIATYFLGRAVHKYQKDKFKTQMGSRIEERRLGQDDPRQDDPRQDEETGPLEYRDTAYEFKGVVVE